MSDSLKDFRSVIEEAYLYSFPMIVNYKVILDYNINKDSGQYKSPINQIANEARVYTPADTSIVTPNSDTPYSMVQIDLRSEPMVISVPEMEKERYYDIQFVDMYTNNYAYAGSRTTGNGAGSFLLAGPDWNGEIPAGISKVYRCETQFSFVIFRTQLFNPDDMDNVRKIQAGYKLQPLSEFSNTPAPVKAPEIEWIPFTKNAFTTDFPVFLNFILQFCPTTGTAAAEIPLREEFSSAGIGAGMAFDFNSLSDEQKDDFTKALQSATAKIDYAADHVGNVVNGWQIGTATGDREKYNGNWALRAAAAKLGIYGNNAEEAVYPFTRCDIDGVPLDGSRTNYRLTFKKGQLPPVNAFWSITIYDGETQLLIDNPINRYLINSPMLSGLIKNDDGSITIYIQKDSPGKDKESNWLPAPDGPVFLVMRLYWPKTEQPSVYPLGNGTWQPPGIIPVQSNYSLGVKRFGDKSVELIVRTDERYGHDDLFQGPRGWGYWNYLEYPKPIQNPNLWPEMQSTYFKIDLKLPKGAGIIFKGTYPHCRYFQIALYKAQNNTFVSTGEAFAGDEIESDPGSENPFVVGANRLTENREFTLAIIADDRPSDKNMQKPNTLYAGTTGDAIECFVRIYLNDNGFDGAGLRPASSSHEGTGLPKYTGFLEDGTRLSASEVVEKFMNSIPVDTKQPFTADQWVNMVISKDNDPSLKPETSPARNPPVWEKYWNINYSIIGAFKSPEDRAKIPYAGAMDGGGDPTTQYMLTLLSRKFGTVYVMKGKMPEFPDTFAGNSGRGLEIMPESQTQYWSIVSCEAAPSGQIYDGLCDMQIPLDKDRNYTIVFSRKEDRPSNATIENGIAWLEWSPKGEGLDDPRNRTDFGMLMIRIMANNPEWKERPDLITKPGMEESVMGPYYPVGEYTSKEDFEADDIK
ncbi:MAG: DUF1254 domain-containing protein [Ignavibacteriae bacterium]|nr:DUF1254 domain-containing protein [Ignavibacteriota bacterium]